MLDIKQQNSASSNVNNKPNVGLMPNFPKKQGKMFRVALGQDDGPFKRKEMVGQPLVDKFSRTTFATRA